MSSGTAAATACTGGVVLGVAEESVGAVALAGCGASLAIMAASVKVVHGSTAYMKEMGETGFDSGSVETSSGGSSATPPENSGPAPEQVPAPGTGSKGMLRPEKGYLGSKKHGLDWKEGPVTAKSLGKPQGQWGRSQFCSGEGQLSESRSRQVLRPTSRYKVDRS